MQYAPKYTISFHTSNEISKELQAWQWQTGEPTMVTVTFGYVFRYRKVPASSSRWHVKHGRYLYRHYSRPTSSLTLPRY